MARHRQQSIMICGRHLDNAGARGAPHTGYAGHSVAVSFRYRGNNGPVIPKECCPGRRCATFFTTSNRMGWDKARKILSKVSPCRFDYWLFDTAHICHQCIVADCVREPSEDIFHGQNRCGEHHDVGTSNSFREISCPAIDES